MKMLVTGGTGFLGQKLAYRLRDAGHTVTALGRNEQTGRELQRAGMRFVRADLKKRDDVVNACQGIDVVFHCGALSSPWGRYSDFYHANVLGTRHVIEGCRMHGIERLIHVSTPSIYFSYTDRYNVAEHDPLPRRFANAYAQTKYMAEQVAFQACQAGLPLIIVRPRALFGPGDTTIIPRLIRANEKGFVPLIDGGRALLDVTYIDNAVDALLNCLRAPESALGKAYNITNGQPIRFRELLDLLFHKMGKTFHGRPIPYRLALLLAAGMEGAAVLRGGGKEPLLTRYTVGVLAKSQTLYIGAAQKNLGYVPHIRIEEGIDRFVQWWKDGADHGSI